MGVPKQACWMVQKVFEARNKLHLIGNLSQDTIIKQVYLQVLGELPKVPWKGLMC